jgi:hypothetical protein
MESANEIKKQQTIPKLQIMNASRFQLIGILLFGFIIVAGSCDTMRSSLRSLTGLDESGLASGSNSTNSTIKRIQPIKEFGQDLIYFEGDEILISENQNCVVGAKAYKSDEGKLMIDLMIQAKSRRIDILLSNINVRGEDHMGYSTDIGIIHPDKILKAVEERQAIASVLYGLSQAWGNKSYTSRSMISVNNTQVATITTQNKLQESLLKGYKSQQTQILREDQRSEYQKVDQLLLKNHTLMTGDNKYGSVVISSKYQHNKYVILSFNDGNGLHIFRFQN